MIYEHITNTQLATRSNFREEQVKAKIKLYFLFLFLLKLFSMYNEIEKERQKKQCRVYLVPTYM